MIQHRRYSDSALVWIEQQIRHHLEENANYRQEIRELNLETDSTHRTWKVTRQPGEPVLPKITWSMTIADVASGYKDASSYRELVRRWTRLTLDEMKPLLRGT
jgi:hypothetical protein